MTHDDDMREIEAALTEFAGNAIAMDTQWLPERDKLLALIRAKLPAADAEHEAKVEAWERRTRDLLASSGLRVRATMIREDGTPTGEELDSPPLAYVLMLSEAVALMRARPAATERDTAAGELLLAAKAAGSWMSAALSDPSACSEVKEAFGKVLDAIEASIDGDGRCTVYVTKDEDA